MKKVITSIHFFLIYTLIFMLSTHVQAEDSVEQLNQFNKPNFGFPKTECQHCIWFSESEAESEVELSPSQEDDLFQQCAVDLCGPAKESPIYKYTLMNRRKYAEGIKTDAAGIFNEKIRPTLRQAIRTNMERNRIALKDFESKLMDPTSNMNAQEWDQAAEALYHDLTEQVLTQNGVQYRLKRGIPDFLVSQEEESIHSYLRNKNKAIQSSIVGKLSSDMSITDEEDFIKQRYQEFLRDYERNKTNFTEDDLKTINRLGRTLENEDLIDPYFFAEELDNLNKKSKDISFCKEEKCKQWVQTRLQSMHRMFTSDNAQEQYLHWQSKQCEREYSTYIQAARQAKTYRENLDQYKDKFISTVFANNYTTQSRQSYQNYINTVHFNLPRPEQEFTQHMLQHIKDHFVATQSDSKISFSEFITRNKDTGKPICLFSAAFVSDSFAPYTSTVNISPFSCTFHEHGKQTLAHEMGHAMSYWFNRFKPHDQTAYPSGTSYKAYMKLRECANRRRTINNAPNPNKNGPFYHNDDKWRTEEDMADLIAYKVFQDNPTPYDCSLLNTSDDGLTYQALKVLYSSSDIDTHSTDFLRVIMEAIHTRKKLSPACRQIIDIYSKKGINFEPCPLN